MIVSFIWLSKSNKNFNSTTVKELIYVTQRYEHRHDKLEVREHDVKTNTVYENYLPGRYDHLKGNMKLKIIKYMEKFRPYLWFWTGIWTNNDLLW
jgi:hypothetical protein